MEFLLTLMLMVVVLSVATGSKEKGLLAGVAVGAVIAFEALFGGPVSGASMNPARSLAPAVGSGRLEHLWVYLTAPVAGALAGVVVCRAIHPPGQCCQPEREATVTHDELERSSR
jgi:aquaporin Z